MRDPYVEIGPGSEVVFYQGAYLGDGANDGQPQAGSVALSSSLRGGTSERLEGPVDEIQWEAAPRVIEDQVVRSAEWPAVACRVEVVDGAGREVHPLDATAEVVPRLVARNHEAGDVIAFHDRFQVPGRADDQRGMDMIVAEEVPYLTDGDGQRMSCGSREHRLASDAQDLIH